LSYTECLAFCLSLSDCVGFDFDNTSTPFQCWPHTRADLDVGLFPPDSDGQRITATEIISRCSNASTTTLGSTGEFRCFTVIL
jgi:hypothetical protein